MKMTGNTIAATRRVRSRSSFRKSRFASMRIAPSSFVTLRARPAASPPRHRSSNSLPPAKPDARSRLSFGDLPHDLEVRVLQRRRVRLDDRQRRLDRAQDLVRAHTVELDAEERRLAEGDPARGGLRGHPPASG